MMSSEPWHPRHRKDMQTASDDVKIRVGFHDDEIFRNRGQSDQPAGPHHKASRILRRSETEEDDDDEDDEDDEDGESDDEDEDDDEDQDEEGAVKPLMHPRKRMKPHISLRHGGRPNRYSHVIWPVVYLLLFIGGLAVFIWLIIYVVNAYTEGLNAGKPKKHNFVGCDRVKVEDVWTLGLPKLMTESAIRLLDVNNDAVLDVVMGFATGGEGYNAPSIVCDIYFNGSHPCLGGLLVVDGLTGKELWRHYTPHEIFAVSCEKDLNLDGIVDCIIAGRVGMFQAVDMQNGDMIWNFTHSERVSIMNVYTGQYLPDLDADGVPEILNIHGGDPFGEPGSATRMQGKLFIFSGRNGHVLRWVNVPDGRESYYSPVLYKQKDGTDIVLFGTGGETHSGSLWYITLIDLYEGRIEKAKAIFTDAYKGVMTPPVLIDLTKDGVEDIVFASYNSTVIAINGQTFKQIWNFTYPWSETYATPAAGYFNDDDVPDFMVHWQYGPGFPIYFHSVTTILDGRDGTPLLNPYVKDTVGVQTSPLTVSMEGQGQDLFLYWISDCAGHEGKGDSFSFAKGTNVHEQSRSDFCRLRFKTHGYSKLFALNGHINSPGAVVYSSDERNEVEHSSWVNSTAEAMLFLKQHPEHIKDYLKWKHWVELQRMKEDKKMGRVMGSNIEDSHIQQLLLSLLQTSNDYSSENDDVDNYGYKDIVDYPNQREKLEESEDIIGSLLRQAEYLGPNSQNIQDNVDRSLYNLPDKVPYTRRTNALPEIQPPNLRNNGYSYGGNVYPRVPIQNNIQYPDNSEYSWQSDDRNNKPFYGGAPSNQDITKDSIQYFSDIIDGADKNALYDEIYKIVHELSETENKLKNSNSDQSDRQRVNEPLLPLSSSTNEAVASSADQAIDPITTYAGQDSAVVDNDVSNHSSNVPNVGTKEATSTVLPANLPNEPMTQPQNGGNKKIKQRRRKRHVGQHDGDGLQRLISTGTIAPSTLPSSHPDSEHSIEVIFATYWFYPAKTEAILPEDQLCIDDMMEKQTIRFDPASKYFGMDNDAYEHAVSHECLEKSGHLPKDEETYESQHTYNPYNIHMGQMTLYRLRLTCTCSEVPSGKSCAKVLPWSQQQWPSYMGGHADSHWIPRRT